MKKIIQKIKFYLYIILFKILLYYSKKIVIPFKTVQNTNLNYIKSLLQNQLYTELEIGTTKQIVYLAISTETHLFFIDSHLINETFYSAEKSTSYKNNSYMYYYEAYQRRKKGYILNETFYLNDSMIKNEITKEYKNIMFNYIIEFSKGYSSEDNGYIDNNINLLSGVIGLQTTKKYSDREEIIFLKSLKNIQAIDKYIWSINYINDNEGYLILGEYPHQYNNTLTENDKKIVYGITFDYEFFWYFTFTDIKIGQNKLKLYRTVEYAPQLGLIVGTIEYKELVDNYFSAFINLNQCTLNEIEYKQSIYSYYECDSNININDFEPIEFIEHGQNVNFTLDKNDLFIDYNNKKYFLVIFQKKSNNNNRWILGKPFVKKYILAFEDESPKIMLFYEKNNKNENNNKQKIYILWYILIPFLGFFVVILGVIIGRLLFGKKKKKKANEMEDTINDEYQNSINSNNNKEDNIENDYNKMGI